MLLRWDKPEKIMSVEAWKDISADSAPPEEELKCHPKFAMLKKAFEDQP